MLRVQKRLHHIDLSLIGANSARKNTGGGFLEIKEGAEDGYYDSAILTDAVLMIYDILQKDA